MAKYAAGQASGASGKTETITFNRDQPIQHSAKDPASLGKEELKKEHPDFQRVIDLYTKAITTNPQAPGYYINRSIGYLKLRPPRVAEALSDAEVGVVLARKRENHELISLAHFRRGLALVRLERYGDAAQCFKWTKMLQVTEEKIPRELKTLPTQNLMVESKFSGMKSDDMKAQVTVKEVPDIDLENIGNDAQKQTRSSSNSQPTAGEMSVSKSQQAPTVEKKPEQTPADKIKHDWYQNQQTVTVTLFAKGIPQGKASVDIQPQSLAISFPLLTGSDFDFSLDPLYAEIDPKTSTCAIDAKKATFTLKKANSGQKWRSLEGTGPLLSAANDSTTTTDDAVKRAVLNIPANTTAPSYPTSSRTGPKNWDKLADELTKRPAKKTESSDAATDDPAKAKSEPADAEDWVDDDEGGDPATGFFKKIFQNADPDTRRAMMKSYQESNGTALSTNWEEVGKKKTETSPPDGMMAKKWGE